jgi:transketolase
MLLSKLEKRIIDISYKKGLSHLSSCLTSVNLIDDIYKVKKENDIFVLSNGHAALALYVVLEKVYFKDAEVLFDKHGVHPNRDLGDKIHVSSGSLGSAITLAVGMAIADRNRLVYVVMSDGEFAEGSTWEALRIAGDLRLENLRIMVNANGFGAYGKIDQDLLDSRIQLFYPTLVVQTNMYRYPHYLQSFDGHYKTLNEEEYNDLITLK